MIPHAGLGIFAASLLASGLLREIKPRTDADRLRDLDAAEHAAIVRAANPHVIAAAQKRERKRLRLLAA